MWLERHETKNISSPVILGYTKKINQFYDQKRIEKMKTPESIVIVYINGQLYKICANIESAIKDAIQYVTTHGYILESYYTDATDKKFIVLDVQATKREAQNV